MIRVQVSLTPSMSKRLIAKGIAKLDFIKKALKNGVIGIANSTTGAFIVEELTGEKVDKGRYACGIITSDGKTCVTDYDQQLPTVIIIKGKVHRIPRNQNMYPYVMKMGPEDVVIKSGNVLDPYGKAAVMLGDPDGGEIGQIMGLILGKGIKLLVPMTLNKTIPIPIEKAITESGICKVSKSMGMPIGLMPLPGIVFTEIDAIKILTGAEAIPISMGSAEGDGVLTMIIKGDERSVEEAWKIINEIKNEPKVKAIPMSCEKCAKIMKKDAEKYNVPICPYAKRYLS